MVHEEQIASPDQTVFVAALDGFWWIWRHSTASKDSGTGKPTLDDLPVVDSTVVSLVVTSGGSVRATSGTVFHCNAQFLFLLC